MNVAFNSGDYIKQLSLGTTQDGLIYLNPENRDILLGGVSQFNNFNPLMVNDNNQLNALSNYTYSSQYIKDNCIFIDDNSNQYYPINKAINIIGNTDDITTTNGYIKHKLSDIISGMAYESDNISYTEREVESSGNSAWGYYAYTTKYRTYTIERPSITQQPFYMVIVFCYTTMLESSDTHYYLEPLIYPITEQEDLTIEFIATRRWTGGVERGSNINNNMYIYKALWI